ncbi:hypothetical protein M427DRAFT_434828 [Gonapodya prolifera JEL478]|uniref:Uncharacterized protein n=1 Tax=Gonapodya prolifera (strain JEL478) TaxID=1344416 RepID=A0A139A3Z4_GONPJ|nr:hypothetical protein M427DRAFT_434828 [Gonapodya prolifera JEL478]|eukprot:KXS11510.1 hypothetical protein M427DRAFT_434828 [Gonapodya prolifera JEL478]
MSSIAMCGMEVQKEGEAASSIGQACGELLALARIKSALRVSLSLCSQIWLTGGCCCGCLIAARQLGTLWMILLSSHRKWTALLPSLYCTGSWPSIVSFCGWNFEQPVVEEDEIITAMMVAVEAPLSLAQIAEAEAEERTISDGIAFLDGFPAVSSGVQVCSRVGPQEPSDSDIGFFRDDPQEIEASWDNAKKWVIELVQRGEILGMTLED